MRYGRYAMFIPRRWPYEAWIPLTTGLLWLWCAASFGVVGFLFSLVPGCLLLSSAVSTLLYPGDVRIPQFTAAGGLLGVPFAVPAIFIAGWPTGLALLVLSAMSFITAGAISVLQEPHEEDVPEPQPSLALAAQVALDDTVLAGLSVRSTLNIDPHQVALEVRAARELYEQRGWLESPGEFHVDPPDLANPDSTVEKAWGIEFEHLRWDSGYEPHSDEPGRERWLGYAPNRSAHAWVLRHPAKPRPWLICIPGYEMGFPRMDFAGFQVWKLINEFQLNVAIPVLPFHGPRRISPFSGTGFIAGNFLDTVHAEAQAMWDIRRLLSWIRAQQEGGVGVWGLSLGGYNAALFSCLGDDLACVIAGIPATDFTRLTWRHGPTMQLRYAERHGVMHDEISEVLRVVSPLALETKVVKEQRYIYAGIADQLVPADQPRDLWRHWDRPRIEWYQGAHLTFRAHAAVRALVPAALRSAGLVA